jgi:glycosyltransferase involved in cell wall biosynthesis
VRALDGLPSTESGGPILTPRPWTAAVFISDALQNPSVEGTQVIAAHLSQHLALTHGVPTVAWRCTGGGMELRTLFRLARSSGSVNVSYLPQNGLTAATMIRAAILALFVHARIELIVTQIWLREPRRWRVLARRTLQSLVVGNDHQAAQVRELNVPTSVLRARTTYSPDTLIAPEHARATLGWSAGPHLLHVGHLRRGRNLQVLASLTDLGEVHVVASPYGREDPALSLPDEIDIHRGVVAHMGLWYRAADVYVFPTVDPGEVSGVPMSVIEALACGTPVVALRSPMIDGLGPHAHLVVVDGEEKLRAAVASVLSNPSRGAENVQGLSQDECGSDLIACGAGP